MTNMINAHEIVLLELLQEQLTQLYRAFGAGGQWTLEHVLVLNYTINIICVKKVVLCVHAVRGFIV